MAIKKKTKPVNKKVILKDGRVEPALFDPDKALELHFAGLSTMDIAKHQGVSQSTIWRFLDKNSPEAAELEEYKAKRVDILINQQRSAAKFVDYLDIAIAEDFVQGKAADLSLPQKTSLRNSLITGSAIQTDKERLLAGKSTSNVLSIVQLASRSSEQQDRI